MRKFFMGFFLHHDFFHRISQMDRRAVLLAGLLTDFRGTLAVGQWLAPEAFTYCFCPTDFTELHRFFFVGLFQLSGGIRTVRTGRICENP